MIFIIEHLEPKLYKWCILEYKHISSMVGKNNLWITNLRKNKALRGYARIKNKSVNKLKLNNVCVLDPEAEKELTPYEAEKFDYFVFGGILGDHPSKERTKTALTNFLPNAQTRNLGKAQMATDNAVYVVKKIVSGKKISELKFTDTIEVPVRKGESVILPYKYVLVNGKPLVSKSLLKMLKKQRSF